LPIWLPAVAPIYHASADFVETATTIGLPCFIKRAVDDQFARRVICTYAPSHCCQLCTRPGVLIKGDLMAVFKGRGQSDGRRLRHRRLLYRQSVWISVAHERLPRA
jgi:hypothetical protein